MEGSSNLQTLTKEELIAKITALQAHNEQLKNVIIKTSEHTKKGTVNKPQKPFNFSKCVFRHVLLKFFYLGWDYQGYVVQEDTTNTIEHCLFNALLKTCLIESRQTSNYHRCGRTDKGVSSFGQTISITLRSKLSRDNQGDLQNEINYCTILNRVLPNNIQCIAWCPIEENFSARFNCKSRLYKYYFPKGNLDIKKMKLASQLFLGVHDFRNFCKMDVGNGVVEFVRNIISVDIDQVGKNECMTENEYTMYVATIKGQAFLWHQIRCIMSVLFLIAEGKETEEIISELLNVAKNPRKPEYSMASELPLNLFQCEYDVLQDWQFDVESLKVTTQKLQSMWTESNVKGTMIKSMISEIETVYTGKLMENCDQTTLLPGPKKAKHIPLMERQKCESLEDRIQHYKKRKRVKLHDV